MSMSRRRGRPGRTFVFLGISGSGKGTQAEFLRRSLRKSRILSTGDGFRRISSRPNFLGRYIREIYRRGGLMPYWAAAHVWLGNFFSRLSREEHIIFEGAPRRVEEAPVLDDFMRDVGRELPVAIYVRLPERAARERLLGRGRDDDNRRAITGRFAFFREHVTKVIVYYRRRGRLITINGEQSVEAVWRDIKKALRLR